MTELTVNEKNIIDKPPLRKLGLSKNFLKKDHLKSLIGTTERLRSKTNTVKDESNDQKIEKIVLQGTQKEAIKPTVKPFILRSGARAGCDASLLLEIDENGITNAALTHWEPTETERGLHTKAVSDFTKENVRGKRLAVLVSGTLNSVDEAEKTELYQKMTEWNDDRNPDLIFVPLDAADWSKIVRSTLYQLIFSANTDEQGIPKYEINVPGTEYKKTFNLQNLDSAAQGAVQFVKYEN